MESLGSQKFGVSNFLRLKGFKKAKILKKHSKFCNLVSHFSRYFNKTEIAISQKRLE